jgi:hypothetical protein
MQEETLKEQLDRLRVFFETNAKNDKAYYKIYHVKHPNTNVTFRDKLDENFDSDSLEESLEGIESIFRQHGPYSQEYFIVTTAVNNRDPKSIQIVIPNPFFNATIMKGYKGNSTRNGINGINEVNGMMLDFMKEHYSTTQGLRSDMKDLQHAHELEKMEERIVGLEEGQKGAMDAVVDFFNTDVGKQLVTGVLGIVKAKAIQPSIQNGVPPTSNPSYDFPGNENEQPIQKEDQVPNYSEDQQDQIQKLNQAIVKMDNVFGGEGLQALFELAQYCENNPEQAHTLRNLNRQPNV